MNICRIVAAAACVALAGCGRTPDAPALAVAPPEVRDGVVRFAPGSPQLERLRVEPVATATLALDEVDAPARIQSLPTRVARLSLPSPGRLGPVRVSLGDRVHAGDVLFTFETPDASELLSSLDRARAEQRQREAERARADADLARARDLLEHRAVAEKDVLRAETEMAAAVAALDQARATVTDLERRLRLFGVEDATSDGRASLRSPLSGEVIEISGAPGEYRTDPAVPVLAIADLSRVWVVAAVPERALARVQPGQDVTVLVGAYPDETWTGRVDRVAGTLDADTRTVRVMVELANADARLKPEMFATVRVSGPARPVVTVPVGSVVLDDQRTSVFVERAPGAFERRPVALGPRHEGRVVVIDGLVDGDRVVAAGTMLLTRP